MYCGKARYRKTLTKGNAMCVGCNKMVMGVYSASGKNFIGYTAKDDKTQVCCTIGMGTFPTRMHAVRVAKTYNKAKQAGK